MKTTGAIKNFSMLWGRARSARGAGDAALWLHIKPAQTKTLSFELQRARGETLRRIGIVLLAASFLTPAWNFNGVGIGAFFLTPVTAGFALVYGLEHHSWSALLLGVMFGVAWLTNVVVFFKLSRTAAALWAAMPWLLFFLLMLSGPNGAPDREILTFFPFYLWAAGLGLIFGSQWAGDAAHTTEREKYLARWLRTVHAGR